VVGPNPTAAPAPRQASVTNTVRRHMSAEGNRLRTHRQRGRADSTEFPGIWCRDPLDVPVQAWRTLAAPPAADVEQEHPEGDRQRGDLQDLHQVVPAGAGNDPPGLCCARR